METYIGSIFWFGGNYAPSGSAFCNGQLLSIAQNAALFSILGTFYGGNGTTTFGLPDLRGRSPMHADGNPGPGLTARFLGEQIGTESTSLLSANLPIHNHLLMAVTTGAGKPHPGETHQFGPSAHMTYSTAPVDTTFELPTLGPAGANQSLPILQPYVTMNACIALVGVFPSRN
jgi:microcystin-dependent protein